jgi:hypothetical protein
MAGNVAVAKGQATKIDWFYSLNLDCTEAPGVSGRLVAKPAHGTVAIEHKQDYPNFAADNPHSPCNGQLVPAWVVTYAPAAGFVGHDAFSYDELFATGPQVHMDINVDVK